MEIISSVSTKEDDAYGEVDLVDLINKAELPKPLYDVAPMRRGDSKRRRINDFKVINYIIIVQNV